MIKKPAVLKANIYSFLSFLSPCNFTHLELMIVAEVSTIYAFKNRFTVLPSLSAFKSLLELDISRNFIVTLEGIEFSTLSHLKVLDISRNNIAQLPDDIVQLHALEVLMVHRNKLISFPSEMNKMVFLKTIDASFNNIQKIENTFESNNYLQDLNLANNENLVYDSIGPIARRLCDKRDLLASKSKRRALIIRAQSISKSVLNAEQQIIMDEHDYKNI